MNIKRNNPQPRLAASVEYGNLVFLSGQTPKSNTPDIAQQTREVLEKIDSLLAEAGSDKFHLLSAQVWLKDITRDFAGFNDVWVSWLPEGHSPARATVQAEMARPEILVEVMITAVKAG
ncbi:RidA family protein [Escherichia coli]|uniref:RidA family protein n=1 Tax=Shigella boydii TaxID=621 RepID=A0A9Q5U8Z9_SHIBO|nr:MULTISPECIES: RidA family protein [Enterobacteriaceae]EFB2319287.1 RidA family protein [Escherichia coli]EFD0537586.1 RidA family protein [Escherichia coli]EFD0567254.1 RidA family protein [Escherichia coli]EFD5359745.1 RidA family protein [Escherichia coli]EFE4998736.1 RidA family protein [Escherichia coli]